MRFRGNPLRAVLLWVVLYGMGRGAVAVQAEPLPPAAAPAPIEMVIQNGHSQPVRVAALSADGALLATGTGNESGSRQGEVKIWDMHTQKLLRTLAVPTNGIDTLSFSSDGTRLAVGAGWKPAIYEVETGKRVVLLAGLPARMPVMLPQTDAAAPEKVVYLCGDGVKIARADAEPAAGETAAAAVPDIPAAFESPEAVAVSPDGHFFAVSQFDGKILLFDLLGRRLAATFHGEATAIDALAFSPDGKKLASGGRDGRLELWSIPEGKRSASAPQMEQYGVNISIYSLHFAPEGGVLLGGTLNGVREWDAQTAALHAGATIAEQVDLLQGGANRVEAVTLTPDGKTLVLGGLAGVVQLWDRKTGRLLHDLSGQAASAVRQARFIPSPDDPPRIAVLNTNGDLSAFTPAKAQLDWTTLPPPSATGKPPKSRFGRALLVMPNGNLVAALGSRIVTYDAATGAVLHDLERSQKRADGSLEGYRLYTRMERCGGESGESTRLIALYVSTMSNAEHLECFDSETGATQWDIALSQDSILSDLAVRPDGKEIAVLVCPPADPKTLTITLRDVSDGHLLRVLQNTRFNSLLAYSPDGSKIASIFDISDNLSAWGKASSYAVGVWDAATGTLSQTIRMESGAREIRALAWVGSGLISGGDDGMLRVFSTKTGKMLSAASTGTTAITSLDVPSPAKRLLIGYVDGRTEHLDLSTQRRTLLLATGPTDYLMATDEGFYRATRGARNAVAFRWNRQSFPFDQFDLKYNRPDKVLAALGSPDTRLAAAFEQAYQKRLARSGFSDAQLSDLSALPTLFVDTRAIGATTNAPTLTLPLRAASVAGEPLDRLLVYVNDVPVSVPFSGGDLRKAAGREISGTVTIPLGLANDGQNRIDISVMSSGGVESLRQTVAVQRVAPAAPGSTPRFDLYVLAVGVSRYRDARQNLHFADHDAEAIAALWNTPAEKDRFATVHVLMLINEKATGDAILTQGRNFLAPAKLDDTVVVFFAGHGLLDKNKDYFFAAHDVDFSSPAATHGGLAYAQIEGLLEAADARQKLLLMDTCHAGEVDKDAASPPTAAITTASPSKLPLAPNVQAFPVGAGRGVIPSAAPGDGPQVGLNESFTLMQELFADLRRGSGAVVIAAAAGGEFAYERQGNGVFTATLLEALSGSKVPRTGGGRVRVNALRDYVTERVIQQTGGAQTPTARRENAAIDFFIY